MDFQKGHAMRNRIGRLMRVAAGLLSFFLLLPIPAYAVISFGNWSVISGSWTDTGSTTGGSNVDTSTLLIQPTTGSTPTGTTATFAYQVPVTFQAGDQLKVTASDLSGLQLSSGILQIQVAVLIPAGSALAPLTSPNPNQFSGPYPQSLTLSAPIQFINANGNNTYNLQVTFTFNPNADTATSWSTTSTPSQMSISFGHP
jgi:hypothetical protein